MKVAHPLRRARHEIDQDLTFELRLGSRSGPELIVELNIVRVVLVVMRLMRLMRLVRLVGVHCEIVGAQT